jgi:hypothetical protein
MTGALMKARYFGDIRTLNSLSTSTYRCPARPAYFVRGSFTRVPHGEAVIFWEGSIHAAG